MYIEHKDKKYILCRIPFTVYFLWKDPKYNKYRLVIKEHIGTKELYNLCRQKNLDFNTTDPYRYKII